MTALNPLAVQNSALLRALDARPEGGWTVTTLADHIGRDRSNTRRALPSLTEAGLVTDAPLTEGLTPEGAAQLAMINRAEMAADGKPGSPLLFLTHAEIQPDPDNARRDWDSHEARDELDSLRADIVTNGLLQNLVVRGPDAEGRYTLVGGERRWRAIGEAIADGDIEGDTPFPCRRLEADDLGVRLAALAENLQRRNLNPIEKATAFEGLAQAGMSNREIAERISATPEHVQQHRRFLQLDQANQDRMTLARDDPRHLSVREARDLLAKKPDPSDEAADDADDATEAEDTLFPAARLVLAEILHRVRNETYLYGDISMGAEAAEDHVLVELVETEHLRAPRITSHGEQAGHLVVSLYHLAKLPFDWAHTPDAEARDAGLRQEQARAAAAAGIALDLKGQTYLTPWLNAPYSLSAEGESVREQALAEAEAQRQRQEARARQDAADQARWSAARQRHLTLITPAQLPDRAALATATLTTAADLDQPLPWINQGGVILDAEGQEVCDFRPLYGGPPSDRALALADLTVLAVNTAADLPTALPEADENSAEEGSTEP